MRWLFIFSRMERKAIFWGVAALVVLIVGGVLAGIYVPRLLAEPVGRTEQIVAVNRGNYRTSAYESFYDLDEQIKGLDIKLAAYPSDPADMDRRDRIECRGVLQSRASLVAEYNASARQITTVGQWRSEDLPDRLPQENPREC